MIPSLFLAVLFPFLAAGVPTAWELKQQAEAAEESGHPSDALRLYQSVLSLESSTPLSRIAQARVDWLQARSVNGFGPLSELLRIRHVPSVTDAELEAFERVLSTWPPGTVRIEAREWLADVWLRSNHNNTQAAQAYRRLLAEPGLDPAREQMATTRLATIESDTGHNQEALTLMRDTGFGKTPAYTQLRVQGLQRAARPIALAMLALFALTSLGFIATGWRSAQLSRAFKPWLMGMALYVVVVPCAVSVSYSPPMIVTYQWLGFLLLGILFLTFPAAESVRTSPAGRLWLAITCIGACLSAGIVAMEHSEMLAGFLQG